VRAGEVGDASDLRVRGGAGRGPGHFARHYGRAVPGDHDAVGAERVGGAEDRAQVHRILNAVEQHHEARPAVKLHRLEDLLEGGGVERTNLERHGAPVPTARAGDGTTRNVRARACTTSRRTSPGHM
jgi:hypothetical protein